MAERGNEQWLAELTGAPDEQAAALADLRERLRRGIFYYLSRERSDLSQLSGQELGSMADDLAQDATLRVMSSLESFRGDSRFTTWATKIAVRLAISDLRRARYRDFSLDELTIDGELAAEEAAAASLTSPATPNPEYETERADVMQKIDRTLREALTERQYQALVAVAVQNVPVEVVAERMGSNRNALYKLLHDARRKLRAALEEQGLPTDYMLRLFEG